MSWRPLGVAVALVFALWPGAVRSQTATSCPGTAEALPCEGPEVATYALRWRAPQGEVTGYRAYIGTASTSYAEPMELGPVEADASGIASAEVGGFDSSGDSYVAITALGPGGESLLSNELHLRPVRCSEGCDDARTCNALVCEDGYCGFERVPDGQLCDDGNAATHGDACQAGICTGALCPLSGAPQSVRLRAGERTESSVTLLWEGDSQGGGRARVRPLGASVWLEQTAQQSEPGICERRYALSLEGLTPLTFYEYQIAYANGSEIAWSDPRAFSTAPEPGTSFADVFVTAFVASTGLPGAPGSLAGEDVIRALGAYAPDALLGGGGYAFPADAQALGLGAAQATRRWFEGFAPILSEAPFFPVYGDEETADPGSGDTTDLYRARLGNPPSGAGAPAHYSFDIGSTHFAALHAPTAEDVDYDLLAWLDSDLRRANERGARHRVVLLHADPYSSHPASTPVPPLRLALLNRTLSLHRVNLVLSGDAPGTELTHPIRDGVVQAGPPQLFYAPEDGVLYLRAGSGGRESHRDWTPAEPGPHWLQRREPGMKTFVVLHDDQGQGLVVYLVGVPDEPGATSELLDVFALE